MLNVNFNRRDFINVGFNVDVPSNVIQTVGLMSDYEDLTKGKELLIDVGAYNQGRYRRLSEPYVQGFKQNPTQYIVIYFIFVYDRDSLLSLTKSSVSQYL